MSQICLPHPANRLRQTLTDVNRLDGVINELGSRSKLLRTRMHTYKCREVADRSDNACGILENEASMVLLVLDIIEKLLDKN